MEVEGIHILNLQAYAQLQGISLYSSLNSVDAKKFYPTSHYLNILAELFDKHNNGHLGYALGQQVKLQSLGLIYNISLLASNILEALVYLNEYLEQSFPLASVYLEDLEHKSSRARIIIQAQTDSDLLNRLIEEQLLIVLHTEMTAMAGKTPSIILHSKYGTYSGPVYILQNEFTGLEFKKNLLHKSLSELQKLKLGQVLPVFLAQLEQNKDDNTQAKVKKVLLHLASPLLPDLQEVAFFLHKSTRSLQRELQEESTSFRKLVNELKVTTAQYLLLNNQLQISDIAHILGYSATSPFLRHFKKSTAMSPKAFRKKKLEE